jgi:hypothetical protein
MSTKEPGTFFVPRNAKFFLVAHHASNLASKRLSSSSYLRSPSDLCAVRGVGIESDGAIAQRKQIVAIVPIVMFEAAARRMHLEQQQTDDVV